MRRYLEPALAAVREVPGVEEAAAISLLPYDRWGWNFNIRYEGQPNDDPSRLPLVENRIVTPEFFRVTGQRLMEGRILEPGDGDRPDGPRVVVVNQALARRDFPGASPVGRRYYLDDTTFATIVGIGDRYPERRTLRGPPARGLPQLPSGRRWLVVVLAHGPDPRCRPRPDRSGLAGR